MNLPSFLAITGPTCSGKTALSLRVAERLQGEIISMDSRQVYRGMDVGTDKVSLPDRARVPHHGLDLLDPDETYSAGAFARDARRWIRDISGRGRVPILAGGTGFFLKAILEPIFKEPELEPGRREALKAFLAGESSDRLASWVRRLDPERAELAVAGGPQRMIRTLEVALLTGRPLSRWHRIQEADGPGLEGMVFLLMKDRERLYEEINVRVGRMVERGLVEEVRRLLEAGYRADDPGMSGTGYREVAEYLAEERSLEEAMDTTRRVTRGYARRQLTWFRNQLPEDTIVLDAERSEVELAEEVVRRWRGATARDLMESGRNS
jgi:tRNA dimethylallyltransferase